MPSARIVCMNYNFYHALILVAHSLAEVQRLHDCCIVSMSMLMDWLLTCLLVFLYVHSLITELSCYLLPEKILACNEPLTTTASDRHIVW
jgi:hypothetical protein